MNEFLTCDEIKNLLSTYFDMELAEEDRITVENHVKNCSNCRQELENIKQLSFSVRKTYEVDSRDLSEELSSYENLLPAEMRKCLRTKSNLSAFIDGELDKDTIIEMLEHIINCEFCKNQYEKIRKTRELTKNYLENPVYNEFYISKQRTHTKVIDKIRQIHSRKKVLTSAAALIFVAVLSWFSVFQFNSFKSDDVNIDKTRFIRTERPMYVKSEDFVISELNSTPPQEVVSLLYGD